MRSTVGALTVALFLVVTVSTGLAADAKTIPDVIHSASSAGEVRFDHRLHYEELGIECAECHHETNAANLQIPHLEYFEDFWIKCDACHRDREVGVAAQPCSNCHHDSPVDASDESLSSKVVIHRSCWRCHEAGTGIEASIGCRSCHVGVRTGPVKKDSSFRDIQTLQMQ